MAPSFKKGLFFWECVIFAALFIIRAGCFGFQYLPLLDDHIQYRLYAFSQSPFNEVILGMGLLSARPLAGIMDVYFWSLFWDKLGLSLVITSLMYLGVCLALYYLFKRHLKAGPVFFAVLAFAPMTMEGTYWLSASSRIVVSMFFGSVAALCLQKYIDKKRSLLAALYPFLLLLSYGFYEQTVIFSLLLSLFVLWHNRKKAKMWLWAPPFLAGGIVACFYLFAPSAGLYQSRMGMVSFGDGYFQHFFAVLKQIWTVFFRINGQTVKWGFVRGLDLMKEQLPLLLALLTLLCLAGALFFLLSDQGQRKGAKGSSHQLLWGLLFFVAPLTLFFLLTNSFISLRVALPSMAGVALLADGVVRLVLGKAKGGGGVIAMALSFIFITGCVFETGAYLDTGRRDAQVIATLYPAISGTKKGQKVALLGAPARYETGAPEWGEHIYAITSSDWALTGALFALHEGKETATVYPLAFKAPVYGTYPKPGEFDIYMGLREDGSPVFLTESGEDGGYIYNDAKGEPFATAFFDSGRWYVERAK